jgi:membrane protease YdiL (CAAX protease family)
MQMLTALTFLLDLILAAYLVQRVIRSSHAYRKLKSAIEEGDTKARTRYYLRSLVFEFTSVTLALFALQFDFSKFHPEYLALNHASVFQSILRDGGLAGDYARGIYWGFYMGILVATVFAILIRLWKNRRANGDRKKHWWCRLLPDFSALLPSGPRERFLFAAVAISAGVCEEVVFRGWLLCTLHNVVELNGTTLVLVAAACFGLVHFYQGATGMIVTAIAGILFTFLYVQSGSLLLPILLHILIDLRWVLLPARRSVDLPILATENSGSVA